MSPTPSPKRKPAPRIPIQKSRDDSALSDAQLAAIRSVGESAAPGHPSHLMPSPQAGGLPVSVGEPRGDQDSVDDLSPERMQESGYPDPEQTPEEGMKSTRKPGPVKAQLENRVAETHKFLDDKLDEIGTGIDVVREMTKDEDEISDYADLPNAPKGDDVLILGPDEPLRVSGEDNGGTITLDKTVYRAHRTFRSKRWSFTLVHPKGTQIPQSVVRRIPEPVGTEPSGTEETKKPNNTETPDRANEHPPVIETK